MIKYKRIAIFVGHSKLKSGVYTCASGVKNEYLVNKELAYEIKKWLDSVGQACDVIIVPEGRYASKSGEPEYKLPIANSGKYDLVIELHLNCYTGSANGSEVLYGSNNAKIVAQRVQDKLITVFNDRKIQKRTDLYMISKVKPTSIMLESFFCDSKVDCTKFDNLGKSEVARRIAEGLLDTSIKQSATSTPSPSSGETFFRVVVASNKVKSSSEKVMNDAKSKGFKDAFLTAFVKDGVTFYRVVVGSYKDRSNATNIMNEAKSKGFNDAFLDAFKK